MHRNERLIDAFLIISTWGDSELRQGVARKSPTNELLCQRLAQSEHPAVIDLLAGFIRRRSIPESVTKLLQTRNDEAFRDAFLRKIGPEPSATILRNLQELGLPKCLRGGEAILDRITADLRAAASHAYAAAASDVVEALQVIVGSVMRGGVGVDSAATLGLSRCEIPTPEFWMRSALPVADGDPERLAEDPNAQLLKNLIELLGHHDAGLQRGVRRVLQPLHADSMLERLESLRPRSRRRLGKVVMMIDPSAIQHVRDALRHPVLSHRLQGIAMADALAAVDLLSDAFAHIAHEDHQEARVCAAQVMGDANGEATLGLLRQLTSLPQCPVRDAAVGALQKREANAS